MSVVGKFNFLLFEVSPSWEKFIFCFLKLLIIWQNNKINFTKISLKISFINYIH